VKCAAAHEKKMGTATKLATVGDIFRQRCPRCRMGNIFRYSIFRGFPKMNDRCLICDLKFDREPGYFLGAMYVSYGLGIVIVASIAALLWWGDWLVDHKRYHLGRSDISAARAHDHALCPRTLDLSRPDHRPQTQTLMYSRGRRALCQNPQRTVLVRRLQSFASRRFENTSCSGKSFATVAVSGMAPGLFCQGSARSVPHRYPTPSPPLDFLKYLESATYRLRPAELLAKSS